MKDSRPSLYAYIFTSVFVIILYVLKWTEFILIVKPVIVPSIFYYYIQRSKRPFNILFSISLWLFFATDMIDLLDGFGGIYLIITCGILSYLIIFRFAILEKVPLNFNCKNLIVLTIIVAVVGLLCVGIIENTNTLNTIYVNVFASYTLIMIVMLGYAVLRILTKNDLVSRLFFAMAFAMFISDYLYAYNRYIRYNLIISVISMAFQFVSYYLMVEYFIKAKTAKVASQS